MAYPIMQYTSAMRPISPKVRMGLTHFVRIPIATGSSHAAMEIAYHRLSQDPLFRALPKDALLRLENLHFAVGALQLDTKQRVDSACRLLRELENNRWRRVLEIVQAQGEKVEHPKGTQSSLHFQPFKIDLVGIGKPLFSQCQLDTAQLVRLYTSIRERTGLLQEFSRGLISIFAAEDLVIQDAKHSISRKLPSQIKLADTSYCVRSGIANTRWNGKIDLLRRFDGRPIIDKYGNAAWAEDIRLGEVRISKIGRLSKGRGTTLQNSYEDIASAALPGFCGVNSA